MAMEAMDPAYIAGRMKELERENAQLKEQLRRLATHSTVARGALLEAAGEREAAAELAHRVTVEERATRAAVVEQGSSLGTALVLQILSFFMLVVLTAGLFFWLPNAVAQRTRPATTMTTPGGTVVIPR